MTEERGRYRVGPTDGAEPPLATEALVARAHAHRQGIPYETGERLLEQLPERLRKSQFVGRGKLDFQFVLTIAAYNRVWMRNLGVVTC